MLPQKASKKAPFKYQKSQEVFDRPFRPSQRRRVNGEVIPIFKEQKASEKNKKIMKNKGFRMRRWNIRRSQPIILRNKKLLIRDARGIKIKTEIRLQIFDKKETSQVSSDAHIKKEEPKIISNNSSIQTLTQTKNSYDDFYQMSLKSFQQKKYFQSLQKINEAMEKSINLTIDHILQKSRILFTLNLKFEAAQLLKYYFPLLLPQTKSKSQRYQNLKQIFDKIAQLISYNWEKECSQQEKAFQLFRMFFKIVAIRDINKDIEDYRFKIKQIKFYIEDQLQELLVKTAGESLLLEQKRKKTYKNSKRYYCSHIYEIMKNIIKICREIALVSTFKDQFYSKEVEKTKKEEKVQQNRYSSSLTKVLSSINKGKEFDFSVLAFKTFEVFFYKQTEKSLHQCLTKMIHNILKNKSVIERLQKIEKTQEIRIEAEKLAIKTCAQLFQRLTSQEQFQQIVKNGADIESRLPQKLDLTQLLN